MTHSLRKLAVLNIFVGFLLTFSLALFTGASPAYADAGGGVYSGSGSGGTGSGGGCNRFHSAWAYSPSVPKPDGGCTANPSSSNLNKACHAGSNVGNWVWYIEQTDGHGSYRNNKGANPGDPKNPSTPAAPGGLMLSNPNTGYQENDIKKILKAQTVGANRNKAPIRNGFSDKSWDSPSNEDLILNAALKQVGTYSGSNGNYDQGIQQERRARQVRPALPHQLIC